VLKSSVAGFEAVVSVTVVSITVGFLFFAVCSVDIKASCLLFSSGFNGYFLIIM